MPDTPPIQLVVRHREHAWVNDAACAGYEYPDHFHPLPDEAEETAAAKSMCAACPVSRQCLDEALNLNDRWGIRGGLSEAERLVLHRRAVVHRWEEQRVHEVLAGRSVSLSRSERDSVVTVAALLDLDVNTWARTLGITRKYALDLLRRARTNIKELPLTVQREKRIAEAITQSNRAVAA